MSNEKAVAALAEGLPQTGHPEWLEPMLAVMTDKRFFNPDWIFERKLDGERVLVFRGGKRIRLLTHNRNPVNAT